MSRLSVINLAELGPMQVIETVSTEAVLASRMTTLKTKWAQSDPPAAADYDVENLEFDPLKINQEVSTYFELMLRDRVNQAARAVTLAFAVGTDLDAIASRYPGGVPRLAGETDDRYRRRVWLSPNILSPHGTAEHYALWALTAIPALHDATAVTIEGTGKVFVTIMPESGSVAEMEWKRVHNKLTGALIHSEAHPVIKDLHPGGRSPRADRRDQCLWAENHTRELQGAGLAVSECDRRADVLEN